MRIPLIHPGDRLLLGFPILSVTSVSGTVGLLTAAAGGTPVQYIGAGFGTAVLLTGSTVFAMAFAEKGGRRAERRAARERADRALRREVDAVVEQTARPASAPGTNAGGGKAAAVRQVLETAPAGTEVVAGPAGAFPALAGVYRRAVAELERMWQPGDGTATGRGGVQIAQTLMQRVPELAEDTAIDLVGDYLLTRAGQLPESDRNWLGVLRVTHPPVNAADMCRLLDSLLETLTPGRELTDARFEALVAAHSGDGRLPERVVRAYVRDYLAVRTGSTDHDNWHRLLGWCYDETREAWIIDLVACYGRYGVDAGTLSIRIDRLGGSSESGLTWVKQTADKLVTEGRLGRSGSRYVGPTWAADPTPAQWVASVRSLAAALAREIKPADGWMAGRGIWEVVGAVAGQVPELDRQVTEAFVRDYMLVRAGQKPDSGRTWRNALEHLDRASWALLVTDMVASSGRQGVSHAELLQRLDWLDAGKPQGLMLLLDRLVDGGTLRTEGGAPVAGIGARYRAADQDAAVEA